MGSSTHAVGHARPGLLAVSVPDRDWWGFLLEVLELPTGNKPTNEQGFSPGSGLLGFSTICGALQAWPLAMALGFSPGSGLLGISTHPPPRVAQNIPVQVFQSRTGITGDLRQTISPTSCTLRQPGFSPGIGLLGKNSRDFYLVQRREVAVAALT